MHLAVILAATLLTFAPAENQDAPREEGPVLKSWTKFVTVIDGDHVKTGSWVLMPEKDPDVYYVEIPRKSHEVTFKTDVDSITFPMSFGHRRDFVILLGDKVRCRTQVRAEYRKLQPYTRDSADSEVAAIPFRLGDNDKIYVDGRLNDGDPMVFQFDLGCGGSIVKKSSVARADMTFDGTATLHNSDGSNVVPSSSSNRLTVGPLGWKGLSFLVGDNMTHREDGLLGNVLFQDSIVAIDYDRGRMTIHDELPDLVPGYTKHRIVLDGVVPLIEAELELAGERRKGWFLFDTGAYTSIFASNRASAAGKLLGEVRRMFGGDEGGPKLSIGDHHFEDINYSVSKGTQGDRLGLIGNDVLKRFNVVLDNQQGFVYLKPNGLLDAPFRNPEYRLARGLVAAATVMLVASAWVIHRLRARRRTRQAVAAV